MPPAGPALLGLLTLVVGSSGAAVPPAESAAWEEEVWSTLNDLVCGEPQLTAVPLGDRQSARPRCPSGLGGCLSAVSARTRQTLLAAVPLGDKQSARPRCPSGLGGCLSVVSARTRQTLLAAVRLGDRQSVRPRCPSGLGGCCTTDATDTTDTTTDNTNVTTEGGCDDATAGGLASGLPLLFDSQGEVPHNSSCCPKIRLPTGNFLNNTGATNAGLPWIRDDALATLILKILAYVWALTRADRNRLVHALNGNGVSKPAMGELNLESSRILQQLRDGTLSEDAYFEMHQAQYPMAKAPFCDQVHYTKFDPDCSWTPPKKVVPLSSAEPRRKTKRSLPKQQRRILNYDLLFRHSPCPGPS